MNDEQIFFFTEDTIYRFRQIRKTRIAIRELLIREKKEEGAINVIVCSDEYLKTCNIKYLGRDYYTDVISFNLSDEENLVSGDLFISIDRVRENAGIFHVSTRRELNRIIVHGVLHLCGMTDESEAERASMKEKEDEYLKLFPN